MRGILVIISIFFTSTTLFAQWSNDPENPLIICADPAAQSEPELVFDGEESYYVFWLDVRSGIAEIYGQRLDMEGQPLWEENGICFK